MRIPRWLNIVLLALPILAIAVLAYVVVVPDANYPMVKHGDRTTELDAIAVAQELLMLVKVGEVPERMVDELCALSDQDLRSALFSETVKRAFWLNVYNSFGQLLLEQEPLDLNEQSVRTAHYGGRRICVAGRLLSLNDIEHGMLRGSKVWWSKGYLGKWFANAFEQEFQVPVDARIHFALNCGAASCPAIAFYDAAQLDQQLDLAVSVYLQDDVVYDAAANTASVTPLFDWYANDFGGRDGAIAFLKEHDMLPASAKPELRYKTYDWTVLTRSFRE